MKRPILDRIASAVFKLENDRVLSSSEYDDKGRYGEPMAWAEGSSLANRFSRIVSDNPLGYRFKQLVADVVAGGDYDADQVNRFIDSFVDQNSVAVFSFTTCPFCRRAKDALDGQGIEYASVELDELEGNRGNEIRAQLGRRFRRTSVPAIFVKGRFVGGCNDGSPGLIPLLESGVMERLLADPRS
jgi:glutaredoxin 3